MRSSLNASGHTLKWALLRTIFCQESAADARHQWRHVTDKLREGFPKLAEFMERTEADVLAYMRFPREHWTQIASTNPIERVNREIKRRCDVIGIFPNDAAIARLVGALMLEQNDEWAVCRRYMSLEGLAAIDGWSNASRLPWMSVKPSDSLDLEDRLEKPIDCLAVELTGT